MQVKSPLDSRAAAAICLDLNLPVDGSFCCRRRGATCPSGRSLASSCAQCRSPLLEKVCTNSRCFQDKNGYMFYFMCIFKSVMAPCCSLPIG